MEKRSYSIDKSERVEISDEEVSPSPSVEAKVVKSKSPETVRLVLLRNLKLNYTGPITGKLYVFNGGGSVLPVDVEDAQIMLAKHGGDCCPGGSGPTPYFSEEG
jgi:hypothetical protein